MPTDPKGKEAIIEKMGKAIASMPRMNKGALLPTHLAEKIVSDALSTFSPSKTHVNEKNSPLKSRNARQIEAGKYVPIGLRRFASHGWVNPFMQFVLFLPGFADLFSFLPRSLEMLREFADQYYIDQKENRTMSQANGGEVVRCLMRKLSPHLFRVTGRMEFYALFIAVCELLSIQYEWKMAWDVSSGLNLSQIAQKKLEKKPPELLIGIRGVQNQVCDVVQRQFFTSPDWLCYDLDAFVEYRPDGQGQAGFITYIKSEGTWYQCDDDRITILRSCALSAPLRRSVLLHYKRISLVQ